MLTILPHLNPLKVCLLSYINTFSNLAQGLTPPGSIDIYHQEAPSGRRQSDMENAKARKVLGTNSDGGGLIAGHVRPLGFIKGS